MVEEEKVEKEGDESEEKKETAEIEKLKNRIAELTDILQHLQADFENYKKRIEIEKRQISEYANAGLIRKMLPILDSFDIAIKNTDKKGFKEGIQLIYAQFHSLLESEGLEPMRVTGCIFDPNLHEVLMQTESDKPRNTIVEDFQPGYFFRGKVLRHAKVMISRGKKEEGKKECNRSGGNENEN